MPTGAPLTVAQLVELSSWDFFDVLHLHTVELATFGDLEKLRRLARQRGVGIVLTVHDVDPHIESDQEAHREKLALVARQADAMLTLTSVAAVEFATRCGLGPGAVRVAPHGAALPPEVAAAAPGRTGSRALAVYGALRPNRDVLAVVRAWQCLAATERPPLRVLLRSVGAVDERRDAETLAALRRVAAEDPWLDLQVRPDFMPSVELVRWLASASALVLPYRWVTHSGQLESACDLGLPVVAPDVSTLAAQLEHNGAQSHPVIWYSPSELATPRRFAERLAETLRLPPVGEASRLAFLHRRRTEGEDLLRLHERLYEGAAS